MEKEKDYEIRYYCYRSMIMDCQNCKTNLAYYSTVLDEGDQDVVVRCDRCGLVTLIDTPNVHGKVGA